MKSFLLIGAALLPAAAAAAPLFTPAELKALIPATPGGPGCAIAIVDNGKLSTTAATGVADLATGRAMTPDTPANIASMTKQFTGMAIALLIADGKLAENDDIRRYLPELRDYGHKIRLAHLLNHSSGLRNHMALAAFQPGDHLPSNAEALALVFRQQDVNFVPGTRHQYESPNYVLLAEIVSRVSGMSYDAFVQQRILEPLGMRRSGKGVPDLAVAYQSDGKGGWTANAKVNGALGSSGLQSTVKDFARWMLNYDLQIVGGAAARERMLSTSTLGDGTPVSYRYGLGKQFDYGGVKGLVRIAHGGQTAAYRSAFSFFPGRGFGDVVMCNHTADANGIDQAIVDKWMARDHRAATPATASGRREITPPRAVVRKLAGWYHSQEDDETRRFVARDGKLAVQFYGEAYPLAYRGGLRFDLADSGTFAFAPGRMREIAEGQSVLSFAKLPPPPAQALGQFAGTYRSGEVDGPVSIAITNGKLVLTYAAGEAELNAIGRDLFANPDLDFNAVRFTRGRNGRVDGLRLSTTSGIKRLRFARVR